MLLNDVKKGTKVRCIQLGAPVTGIMADNLKGNTRMVEVKGSELGLYDETGSVYAADIVAAEVNGEWVDIQHTEKQLAARNRAHALFG